MKHKLKKIIAYIQKYYDVYGAHSYQHTHRVFKICRHIGKNEKVNQDVLDLAAILHDVGRKYEKQYKNPCHAIVGAQMAEKILNKNGFSSDIIDQVVYCIRNHRKSDNFIPKSNEIKVLIDADRLESIGCIGIMRTVAHFSKMDLYNSNELNYVKMVKEPESIFGWIIRLAYVNPNSFYTKSGKVLCINRIDSVNKFIRNIKKELFV